MDLGVMAMKGCSAFPKAPALLELPICVLSRTLVGGGGSYPSAEKQSVYSIAPTDWVIISIKVSMRATSRCFFISEINKH